MTLKCSCPTEIRLKHTPPNEPWRCIVSLRRHPDDEGGKLLTIPFGEEITRPDEVEARLRKAQLAILNPSREPEGFLYDDFIAVHQTESYLGHRRYSNPGSLINTLRES